MSGELTRGRNSSSSGDGVKIKREKSTLGDGIYARPSFAIDAGEGRRADEEDVRDGSAARSERSNNFALIMRQRSLGLLLRSFSFVRWRTNGLDCANVINRRSGNLYLLGRLANLCILYGYFVVKHKERIGAVDLYTENSKKKIRIITIRFQRLYVRAFLSFDAVLSHCFEAKVERSSADQPWEFARRRRHAKTT